IEAENSMGFHAGQEAARLLANAMNYARMGQVALRGGRPGPVATGLAGRAPADMPPQGEAALREREQEIRARQRALRRDTTPR
ncbi:MAG TPA: hypothetical protein VMN60_09920, partial [Longimicrobiales bacterium]|nr:hypothetical protein [Longimicrobiales bacterium]